ncbi:hypothetical protein K7X08_005852 [Anisodus acutangulus]|uniref:Uncharacterized protein n=1 Tax=Anisodus acutangulus TaxID=402998 RepID=A0A9Q1LVN6_9SOLA|nr:hypothetical protein K7X08_005852 [Anisodus acutangulus]
MIPSDDSDDSDKSVTTDSEDPYSSSSGESDSYICTSKELLKNREEDTEDEFYKLQAQFSSFNVSVINGEEINDLLKDIPEDAQKAKILDALLKAQEKDRMPHDIAGTSAARASTSQVDEDFYRITTPSEISREEKVDKLKVENQIPAEIPAENIDSDYTNYFHEG